MLKPLNQFNAMLDEIIGRKLSGSEQLVLLHLYNAFNRAHWAETIHLSDESLRALMNLYDSNGKPASIETVRRAKQKLKSKGLIDFTSGKGSQISEYKLVKWYSEPYGHPVTTPADTVTDTPKDTPEDALIKYTLHGGNQEDVKTVRREDRTTTTTTTRAREGEGESENPTPNIKVGQNSDVKVIKASATVVNCWRQATYMNPTELDEKGLAELEKEFGTEKVYAAIIKANRYKQQPQINLNNVEVALRGKPKTEGAEVVRSVRDNRNEGNRERSVQRDNRITTDYDAMFGFDD